MPSTRDLTLAHPRDVEYGLFERGRLEQVEPVNFGILFDFNGFQAHLDHVAKAQARDTTQQMLDRVDEPMKRDGMSITVLERQCAIESPTGGRVLTCLRCVVSTSVSTAGQLVNRL